MRHRCSPWDCSPLSGEGMDGWKVLKDTPEPPDWKLKATFHFDRTSLLISMCTPTGVLEQSPENSRHPGDLLLLRVHRLFLTLHAFACNSVQHIKNQQNAQPHHRHHSGCVCVVHHLWSFHLDLVFRPMLINEPGKATALLHCSWFLPLIVNEPIVEFAS